MKRISMLLLAAALLLSGCNGEAGSQENGKAQEVVEASDKTDKTDSFVKDSEEGAEDTSDVAEATDSTIPDGSTETVAGSGEIQNSKKFEDYWDYENDAFDLEEYLKSTNPSKDIVIIEDNGVPVSYCASYDNNWCIAINDGGLKVGIFGKMSTDYFYVSPKSLDLTYVKSVYVDNHKSLHILDSQLIYLEAAIKLVKTNSNISSIDDMETVFTKAGIETFIYEH